MSDLKFDERDRTEVVSAFEQTFGIKLRKLGRRSIYREDQRGRRYCVIGGYGEWHGIPDEVFTLEGERDDSLLILARRYAKRIDVYLGSLSLLIRNRNALTSAQGGKQYQFNLEGAGHRLRIREVPDAILWMCGRVTGEAAASPSARAVLDAKEMVEQMTASERQQLIDFLRREA